MKFDTDRIIPLAARFNLSLTAFGESITPADTPAYGTVTLSDAWGNQLAPAPVTPTGPDAVPYKVLSGTIKATFDSHRAAGFGLTDGQEIENETIVVSPGIMTGNTGTVFAFPGGLSDGLKDVGFDRYALLLEVDASYLPVQPS